MGTEYWTQRNFMGSICLHPLFLYPREHSPNISNRICLTMFSGLLLASKCCPFANCPVLSSSRPVATNYNRLTLIEHKGKGVSLGQTRIISKRNESRDSKMANCQWLWTIVWFIALLIVWPIGFLCAIIYELVVPFCACCNGCSDVRNFFQKGLDLPYTASRNMVQGKSLF